MKLKICGLRHTDNINALLPLQPDYLGFIFYKKSKRYAGEVLDPGTFQVLKTWKVSRLGKSPVKTGVFVNETVEQVMATVEKYGLDAVQLHGDESVDFCRELSARFHPPAPLKGGPHPHFVHGKTRMTDTPPIAQQPAKDNDPAESVSRLKSPLKGGRGVELIKVFSVDDDFDFDKTKAYEPVCDYFLFDTKGKERGGNGIAFNWDILQKYQGQKPFFLSGGIGPEDAEGINKLEHPMLYGIDINSRFELEPGLKDVEKVRSFIEKLKNRSSRKVTQS